MKQGFKYDEKCSRHFTNKVLSYDEALSTCQTWDANATLYMPQDSVEKQFWRETLEGLEQVWIGVKRDVDTGEWHWQDGNEKKSLLQRIYSNAR